MSTLQKNLMVTASAGSGKTYRLSNRIIALAALGENPESIVALTFTRKAAAEFADALLHKLSHAVLHQEKAAALQLPIPPHIQPDFTALLENFTRLIHRLTLGTMDSFFSRIVRSWQTELGIMSGKFQLIEGAEKDLLQKEIIQQIIAGKSTASTTQEFTAAFRRTMKGREKTQVTHALTNFVNTWASIHRLHPQLQWAPQFLWKKGSIELWLTQRINYAENLNTQLTSIHISDKRQLKALTDLIENIATHTPGSGKINDATLMNRIIEMISPDTTNHILEISYYKPLKLPAAFTHTILEALHHAAQAEIEFHAHHTHAVQQIIAHYDHTCAQHMRAHGKFHFDDVKALMNEWTLDEEKRLSREAQDFRLDAHFTHWLLDEFQDTSRADWNGLKPMIEESIFAEQDTTFIVGDQKQAIYGWRGGDVSLFPEIKNHYQFTTENLNESYRSTSEILSLINLIFGNKTILTKNFGDAADDWNWQDHISARTNAKGHARVEIIAKDKDQEIDPRLIRIEELLRTHHAGNGSKNIAILVRKNDEVTELSAWLRTRGFRVIEEGQRKPTQDHPIGVAILHLMRWLHQPHDPFSLGILKLSPLQKLLEEKFPNNTWKNANIYAITHGLHTLVTHLLAEQKISPFAHTRIKDITTLLRQLHNNGKPSAQHAWLAMSQMKIPQEPGIADVQVMTIHKSKGLGFDIVIVPFLTALFF